jgi:ABC-2 type transport system permease protein
MRYLTKRNRAILREMISTDFKVRYQGSVLGYLWSLLKPLFLFAILYVVFTMVFKLGKGVPHYPVYLFMGIVLWNFFNEATMTGLSSIVGSGDLIRKISIPRYLIVVASSVSALINLGLNIVVILIFAFINGVPPTWEWLLVPVLVVELYIFAQAVAFFLAALYVKFRDINYIWELILQAGFYATPILYPLTLVPLQYQKYLLLNPMAQIIQDARYLFVTHESVTIWQRLVLPWSLLPLLIIVVVTLLAAVYFKKKSHTFAEDI